MFGIMWICRTRRMGTLLIFANVQVPELATEVVHPHRALAERYRIGIPATFLGFAVSYRRLYKRKGWKLRIGIKSIELSLVKRKEAKLILYKASLRVLSPVNLCDAHHWRRRVPHSAQTSPIPGARWALPVWISQCVSSCIEVLVVVCLWEKAEMILPTLASALVQVWLLRGQLQQMMMSLSSLEHLLAQPLVEVT